MDEVKDLKQEWDKALNYLMNMPKDKRTHFALVIVALAECYVPDSGSKAVVLVTNSEDLSFISAGADEYEAFEIIDRAHKLIADVHTMNAPEKGYFN